MHYEQKKQEITSKEQIPGLCCDEAKPTAQAVKAGNSAFLLPFPKLPLWKLEKQETEQERKLIVIYDTNFMHQL